MVIDFILVIVLTCVLAYIANCIYNPNNVSRDTISFKESMDLTDLPVITFYNNNKKINFLLDTGSNNSIINNSALEGLEYEKHECSISTYGMEGNKVESSRCSMSIYIRDKKYEDDFTIMDMNNAFGNIKQDSGVTIHGILGSKFFEKYKYVLDFSKLIAYSK